MENHEHSLPPRPDAQWVSLWLDDQLSPEQQQLLLQALEQDAQLAQLARQWKQLRQQLQSLPRVELGEEFTQGVLDRIEAVAAQPETAAQDVEPAPAADSSEKARPAGGKPVDRFPWEFWACVGTGVLAASLLLVWVFWEPAGPGERVVMQGAPASPESTSAPGHDASLPAEDRAIEEAAEDVAAGRLLLSREKEAPKGKFSVAKRPPHEALERTRPAGKQGLPSKTALPRAAGPRPKALVAGGGTGRGALRAETLQARHMPPTQVIPWERLPKPLQSTLAQSQRAGFQGPSQVLVLRLGVRAEALRQGWLGSQLAGGNGYFSFDKARRALAPLAASSQEAIALGSAGQENDRKNRGQEKATRRSRTRGQAAQVVRVQVSQEQLPQLLNQLTRSQAPIGPVQYLHLGYLVSGEAALQNQRKESQAPGRASAPGASAVQGLFSSGKHGLEKQRMASQQLVLQTVPQVPAPAAVVRQQAANTTPPSKPAENQNTAEPKPSAQQAASPVVDLWLVVEVQTASPPRGKLPLVAPPPKHTP